MNRTLNYAIAFAFAAAVSSSVLAQAKAPVAPVATVNGKAIPQARADALVAAQAAQGQPDSQELRQAVREELVRREILTQESMKKGFDKKVEVQAQMELARQGVLIGAYLNDFVRGNPVTEAQIQKEYETIKAQLGAKEYKVRHILLDKEDVAKGIIDKLKAGEKFEDLAKQSLDPGSKDRGGDLGWANRAAYVKPFSDAMVALEKGATTTAPVRSDFGWHVIQLEDVRDLQAPPFDEVKGQIGQRLQQQSVQAHIDSIRLKAKVD
jgi:peptidyl-prolyl cis-trans isomerase C